MKNKLVYFTLNIIIKVLSYIINIFISAFVFSLIWEWFIVTKFDFQSISITESMGIVLLAYILSNLKRENLYFKDETTYFYEDEDDNNYSEAEIQLDILEIDFYPIFFLIIGWIIKIFIGKNKIKSTK